MAILKKNMHIWSSTEDNNVNLKNFKMENNHLND